MRGGSVPSPASTPTPRRDGAPPVIANRQSSLPVSGSSATTRFAAGTYITPFTTIGVASEFGPGAPTGGRGIALQPIRPHRSQSRHIPALISVSGEHRSRRIVTIHGQIGIGPGLGARLQARVRLGKERQQDEYRQP